MLAHNAQFFKGLWQLELVSMKFEALIPAFAAQQAEHVAFIKRMHSDSSDADADQVGKLKLDPSLPAWDPTCALCALAGPNHPHHASHARSGAATSAAAAMHGSDCSPRDSFLTLLFVTDPRCCPPPYQPAAASAPSTPTHGGSSTGTTSASVSPATVPPDSPLSWTNLRGGELLCWLRSQGRSAQLIDVVDVDWSSGMLTAWITRNYVNFVRKRSSYAQVAVLDFERMKLLTPTRSVVHLKTIRSMNIR